MVKRKIVFLVSLAIVASFVTGAFANRVVVQDIQSIGGNHVLVPAPELQILNVFWNINVTDSTVTGVILNVTTVAPTPVPTVSKLYTIDVEVSGLNPGGTEFILTSGITTIILPSNMNGAAALVPVKFVTPIDPETTEIHDLSFIVTGTPTH